MLLIEKQVKLLDDFHFNLFREYVKNLSLRSYYPLALIDVISRNPQEEQDSTSLYKLVYGEEATDEKALKKFFQLAHYTFRQSHFLSRNYPNYLMHNISQIQHLISQGELSKATHLALMLKDVAEKIEDWDTCEAVLKILAQRAILLESPKDALRYYEESQKILQFKNDLNDINQFFYKQYMDKGKNVGGASSSSNMSFFEKYFNSESHVVRTLSRLHYFYSLHLLRDETFYGEDTLEQLSLLKEELIKYNYIIFPYLHNLLPKVSFLKLMYSLRKLSEENVLEEARDLLDSSQDDLFWNSFINLPEFNSIGIQTSHLVSNYFTSYREDHLEILPEETVELIQSLKKRCRAILDNPLLEEAFTTKYINLTTVYAGLLLLGSQEDIKEAIWQLENLLIRYQQLSFHAFIDSIFLNLILASFCIKDYEKLEKYYRRYKKSTKEKVVVPENDFTVHLFYYTSKWLLNKRQQYVNKIEKTIAENTFIKDFPTSKKLLLDLVNYYNMPITIDF